MKKEDVFNMISNIAEEARNMVTGYEVVAEEVRKYWREHGASDVVCYLTVEGCNVNTVAQCESDYNFVDVTFNYDWWEGEPLEEIKVVYIIPLDEVLNDYRSMLNPIEIGGKKDGQSY